MFRRIALVTFLIVLILLISACGSSVASDTLLQTNVPTEIQPNSLPTLDAGEISQLGSDCRDIYTRMIDAWDSRDAENFRQAYTDDVIFFDGEPEFNDIDSLINVGAEMLSNYPEWKMQVGETFISQEQCLGTWVNWDIFGFTKDNPSLEYDLLNIRDGKVSYWRLFYDQGYHKAITGTIVEKELLSNFASTWSQADTEEILSLYSQDAKLEDTLFGINVENSTGARGYINAFLARSKGADWQLLEPFAEKGLVGKLILVDGKLVRPSEGGVFGINVKDASNQPCQVRIVLILTYDDEVKIVDQKTFYDADSLVTCGWAE